MMTIFLQGLGTGAGLIIAIGAQNAFVLSQGVRKQYVWIVAMICAVCDGVLIFSGAAGVGKMVATNSILKEITAWGGALFLFYYGIRSLQSAIAGGALERSVERGKSDTITKVVGATLAVTLLNPHVYLDTLVLVGSISGQFGEQGRYVFALGASTASFLWFFSLGGGGVILAPVFESEKAWRLLDITVWLVMWGIAVQLLLMD
ncbi:LysE/ArgO family amino acid transporter [Desulfopila sp. IMCC35008]|uniref:LysE/ArgO family amino acid transporter n=1 Tax=Desulfopila sp. IMCC35008 TaxID=2653858 RepID=UPI00197AB984|nr:LysE/ArgO family amino acid transporter [Desulfopila sp. IMCC35008]